MLERTKYLVKVKTGELTEYTVWKFKEIAFSGLTPCCIIFEIGRFARTLLKDIRHHWNPCSYKQWDKMSLALHASRELLNKSCTQIKKFMHQNFPRHKVHAPFLNPVITKHCSFSLWQHFCYFGFFFPFGFNLYLISINRFSNFPLSIK